MTLPPRTLTIAEAADELGVAPARVRALLASGALKPIPVDSGALSAADVADLVRRGTVRAVDVAAVEGAVDRALRRRLPALLGEQLEQGLTPVAREVATALADVELAQRQLAQVEERARLAEQALAEARTEVLGLQARVAELEAQPVGLLRRRRRATGVAPA